MEAPEDEETYVRIQGQAADLAKKAIQVLTSGTAKIDDAVFATAMAIMATSAYKTFMDAKQPELAERWMGLFLGLLEHYLKISGHAVTFTMLRKEDPDGDA